MVNRFIKPDYDFEPMEEGHASGVSRLILSCRDIDDESDITSATVWELDFSCGVSDHNYRIFYRLTNIDDVVETLVDWATDDELPLTSSDVAGIMSALVGFSDGADSGETTY